jgi:type I restriction enzyme S subunit
VTDNALYISEYLCHFDLGFLTRLLRFKDLRSRANQMAQPVISYTTIKDTSLAFPLSKVEQKKLSSSFDALEVETERLVSLFERKLAALEELKKSLLDQAFTGKL